jgi:hypothetical protein
MRVWAAFTLDRIGSMAGSWEHGNEPSSSIKIISGPGERLSASEERLCSVGIVLNFYYLFYGMMSHRLCDTKAFMQEQWCVAQSWTHTVGADKIIAFREGSHAEQYRGLVMKFRYTGLFKKKYKKAVPLHAIEAHGVRGGIAPTHT